MSVTIGDNGLMTTGRGWQDGLADDAVRGALEEIVRRVRADPDTSRYLFHGGDPDQRRLAAALIAKSLGREVRRVDLSAVVSQDIGETEKNLDRIFAQARDGNWILFFDEADAPFGKRSEVADSHDRYANAQIGYFLQRIEAFPGIVILASNLRSHMDEAFARRLQSIVNFAKTPA